MLERNDTQYFPPDDYLQVIAVNPILKGCHSSHAQTNMPSVCQFM